MPLYRNFVDFVSNQVIGGIKSFTQNLGLGISTPQTKLHIDSGDATASNIKFTAGTTTGQSATDGFDIGITNIGVGQINQRANAELILATANARRFTISGGGIVTINSTQQSTASNNGALVLSNGGLGVAGAINSGNNITIAKTGITSSELTISNNFGGAAGTANSSTVSTLNFGIAGGIGNEGATCRIIGSHESYTSAQGSKLSFFTRAASFGSINENMVLKGNGNLLLGATTDDGTNKLQVTGSGNFTGKLNIADTTTSTSNGTGAVTVAGGLGVSENINAGGTILAPTLNSTTNIITPLIRRTGTSGTNAAGLSITLQSGAGTGAGALSSIIFNTADLGVPGTASQNITEKMRLVGSGNLLIGTTTDNGADKLQVAGSISANLVADSTVLNVAQNTGSVTRNLTFGTNGLISNTRATFGGTNTVDTTLEISTSFASRAGIVVRGSASQSGDLQQWRDSSNGVLCRVNAAGIITAPVFRQSPTWTPPANANSPGVAGEFGSDSNFYYYCWSNNNWKRTALSAW